MTDHERESILRRIQRLNLVELVVLAALILSHLPDC